MKVNGKMTIQMVRVNLFMLMVIVIRVTLSMEVKKDKVNIFIVMVVFMTDLGKVIKSLVMEFLDIPMGINIMVSGQMI